VVTSETEFRYGWINARAAMAHLGLGSTSAFVSADP
jgi:hypothetical protein